MSEKYIKEIASELKLIRKELQKSNKLSESKVIKVDSSIDFEKLRKHGEEQSVLISKE